mgnify:CR=1 FL=1
MRKAFIFILLSIYFLSWSNEVASQERINLNRDWRYQENDPSGTDSTLHYSRLKPYLLPCANDFIKSGQKHIRPAGNPGGEVAYVKPDFDEPAETTLTRAFGRLAALDSRRWISFLLDILPRLDNVDFSTLPPIEQRMLQMFYVTVWGKVADDWQNDEVLSNLYSLSNSPVLLAELLELLQLRFDVIDFLDQPVDLGFACPLDVHCTYTRDQLLVALDFDKPATVREGVKWLPDKQLDVFFVTLNKADKDYSPTTMYKDYSINETLFHWQSQSTTTPNSSKGQRYIHHREMGTKILLFVREFKNDLAGAAPYTFLGTASYVKHEGSRPMSITWKLDVPIPAKYLKKTNKLVVG